MATDWRMFGDYWVAPPELGVWGEQLDQLADEINDLFDKGNRDALAEQCRLIQGWLLSSPCVNAAVLMLEYCKAALDTVIPQPQEKAEEIKVRNPIAEWGWAGKLVRERKESAKRSDNWLYE